MSPAGDDLLRKADALMMRRRSFVARDSRFARQEDDELPVLTEIVVEAEAAAAGQMATAVPAPEADLERRIAQLLPQQVEQALADRLSAELPARLEARLAEILPGKVEEALPARLADALPEMVEQALPERIARELPAKVEAALATRLAEILPQEVERVLPTRMAEELPAKLEAALELALAEHMAALQPRLTQAVQAWLASEVPQLVTRQLDSAAEQITREVATQFRVTLLPELDALLTPPERGHRR